MSDLKNKRIITVATTGAWPHKKDNPNVPTQPPEIAEEIYQCWKIGAAVAHLHVRDENDNDSMKVETFKAVIDILHAKHPDCNVVINMTAAGGIANSEDDRIAPFKTLRPEMASFDCGTMNWMHFGVFNNNPPFLERMGKEMIACGVKPEVEVFDLGMIYEAAWYVKQGVLKAPVHYQFMMGVGGALSGRPENIQFLKSKLPEGSTWSVSGIGKCHLDMMFAGLAYGADGLRVGLEDNIYLAHGVKATNEQLVARCAELCRIAQREPANAAEAREMLNIPAR